MVWSAERSQHSLLMIGSFYLRFSVNGRLNMSRSIGDIDLKPYGVTAMPDVSRRNLKHGKDKFLVLMTDGIPSALTDNEIIGMLILL